MSKTCRHFALLFFIFSMAILKSDQVAFASKKKVVIQDCVLPAKALDPRNYEWTDVKRPSPEEWTATLKFRMCDKRPRLGNRLTLMNYEYWTSKTTFPNFKPAYITMGDLMSYVAPPKIQEEMYIEPLDNLGNVIAQATGQQHFLKEVGVLALLTSSKKLETSDLFFGEEQRIEGTVYTSQAISMFNNIKNLNEYESFNFYHSHPASDYFDVDEKTAIEHPLSPTDFLLCKELSRIMKDFPVLVHAVIPSGKYMYTIKCKNDEFVKMERYFK